MNIRFVMWFNNEDDGLPDYGVFGSRNGTNTYVSPITNTTYLVYNNYANQSSTYALPLNQSNPRIITDPVFSGNFL